MIEKLKKLRDSLLEIDEEMDTKRGTLIDCERSFEKTILDGCTNIKQSNEILLGFLPSMEEATQNVVVNTSFLHDAAKRKR